MGKQSPYFSSVIELNRIHKKVPVRLCSIAEPIERLDSIGFDWFWVRFRSIDYARCILRLTLASRLKPSLLLANLQGEKKAFEGLLDF